MDSKDNKDKKNKELLKEAYNKLKEKYELPDFDLLNKDFEIDDLDAEENIIRDILKEIHNTVEFYTRLLDGLIQPDSKLSDMKEAEVMSADDHLLISELYAKCMLISRTLLLIDLEFNTETAAQAINKTHRDWQDIKSGLKIIISKMRETWREQKKKKEIYGGYYG